VRALIRARLDAERGRIDKHAPFRVALAYPSPYAVGMSSLGYQQIYRLLQGQDGIACERVFLADDAERQGDRLEQPVSYESQTPLSQFPLVAFSVAYELELAGLLRMLMASGLAPIASERLARDPIILAGGPLTFSNPLPLAPFVDAVVMGEAEGIAEKVARTVEAAPSKAAAIAALANIEHVWVPSVHGQGGRDLPRLGSASDENLPARSVIITPHTELSQMFLIEAERGCSRTCTYCVMRRSAEGGGMRRVPKEALLGFIPEDATKVGLVGAAVSDHPEIVEIVNALADRGLSVGLSSLRPDRLKQPFVQALKRAGYKTLTTALDGASERLRSDIERRGREPHYRSLAEFAREVGMQRLKLYLMVGLPGETDADIDECADFVSGLSRVLPVALGIAPFCAKRRTPLDGQPYAGIDVVQGRLARLRRGLAGRADVRATSAKWAWVEYVLAQGGPEEGLAVLRAVRDGGDFRAYRKVFEPLGYRVKGQQMPRLPPPVPPPPVIPLRKALHVASGPSVSSAGL
jgi:radical SAM superfamily enzyme YgiQ (UPF0313 family)